MKIAKIVAFSLAEIQTESIFNTVQHYTCHTFYISQSGGYAEQTSLTEIYITMSYIKINIVTVNLRLILS